MDDDGSGLGTDVKTDAATGAAGTFIGYCVIALAIKKMALAQNRRRTSNDAKTAALTQVSVNNHFTTIRIAHTPPAYQADYSRPERHTSSPAINWRQSLFPSGGILAWAVNLTTTLSPAHYRLAEAVPELPKIEAGGK